MTDSENQATLVEIRNKMRFLGGWLLSAIIMLFGTRTADAESAWSNVAWGVTVGDPQLVALTMETHQNEPFRFQSSFSTIILYTSFTCRAIVIRPTGRFLPYGFGGGGLLHAAIGEGDGAIGATGFYWAGGGLRLQYGAGALFGEVGYYGGMDTSKGYESSHPSFAVGILYDF